MGQTARMHRTSSTATRSAALVVAAALLLAACGSSDSDGAEATTTSADEATTTTEAVTTTEASTTTEGGDEGEGPTVDQLADLLPTAEEVGEGWYVDEDAGQERSAIEVATEEQCPEAAGLLAPPDDDDPTVAFTNDRGQTLRVTLETDAEAAGSDLLQEIVDGANGCDPVSAEEGSFAVTAEFEASLNDTYGDEGIQIVAAVNLSNERLSVDANKYRLLFRSGAVGVSVAGGDGVEDDGTVTPIEGDVLDATATEMADRVASL